VRRTAHWVEVMHENPRNHWRDRTGIHDRLLPAAHYRVSGAANTPHVVFEDVRRLSAIPLISIVESACEAARSLNLESLGLLGTRFVMQGEFYPRVFSKAGITLIAPTLEEQAYIHDKYMTELLKGLFLPETREQLLRIVDRLIQEEKIEGLILAGTELPLILRDVGERSVLFLDTTKIHVNAALRELI